MQKTSYEIVSGVVIVMIILLIAVSFIFILVSYSNKRKKLYLQERKNLELAFKEQLLQSKLEIQEQTFSSISQEIHDNVGQLLSLAKVQVSIIEQSQVLDNSLLKDLKENIGQAMFDLRDIARSLNSDRIKLCSLDEMTNEELQRINRTGVIEASLSTSGNEIPLAEQKKLILFRMLQESFQNILKHAQAKRIEVSFTYHNDHLEINISDNGVGFDPNSLDKRNGLGLQNISDRAILIGGSSSIKSVVNKGTTIILNSPYE